MSVASPCEICQRVRVEGTCDRCGRLVCDRHFEVDYGYCTECVAAIEGDRGQPVARDGPDGVDTYRF